MQSVFVIITKLIASKHYFCKEVFCNNFGRDGIELFFVSVTYHLLGNEKSARSFSDRRFFMDVRVGCPFRNACFFQDLEGLTEVFDGTSAGMCGPKLPL